MNREQRRHPGNNGLQFLPQLAAQAQPQAQPVFQVGPLMLGDQLVALVAKDCLGGPKEAVDRAMEIVAQALARTAMGELDRRVKAIVADATAPT